MHPHARKLGRAQAVLQVQSNLERHSFPRLHMTLIAALTGAVGWLSSYVLLGLGLDSMALRFPLALTLAYAGFLFLIWLWLRTQPRSYIDAADLAGSGPVEFGSAGPTPMSDGVPGPEVVTSGGGGNFAGGGAGGSFDAPYSSAVESPVSAMGARDAADVVSAADDFATPLLAVALAVGLAFASLYVVYIAPALLAEVLVDGALSYGLYRHLRKQDPGHWLATAVRRTAVPFLATGLFLVAVGVALSAYTPGARTIGDVVRASAR